MSPACPSCHADAGHTPKNTVDHLETRAATYTATPPWGADDWWCRDCLAAKIAAHHADDCRCGGCQR